MGEIIYDMPELEYHATTACGSTVLAKLDKGGDYLAEYLANEETGSHYSIGSAVHLMLLQPHLVKDSIAVADSSITDKRTKAWKEFVAGNLDKITFLAKEFDQVTSCASACLEHPTIKTILDAADHKEVSVFWDEKGVKCKGRFDLFIPDMNMVADLKTTSKGITPDKVRWMCREYCYNIQGAHYVAGARHCGIEIETYALIVVDKSAYKARVYELSQDSIERAEVRRQKLLDWFKDAKENGFKQQYEIEVINV